MLHGGNPLTVGVGIVIEVIRKNNSDYDPENGHNPDAPPTNHDPIYLGTLLRMFAKHVPDFMELILSSKHTVTDGEKTKVTERGKLSSAWGTEIEPLGFDRFKTCELMAELLHCSNMGLLNERGGEEFIRQRDAERDRLRAAGAFAPHKEEDESAVDISEESTGYANGNASLIGTSTEELRVANSSEEDGFEKVTAPEKNEDSMTGEDPATFDDAFTEIQDRSKAELGDNLVDAPQSPKIRTNVEKMDDETEIPSLRTQSSHPLSPTTASLVEKVRRVSLEDTTMTSPPNETEDVSEVASPSHGLKAGHPSPPGLSPRPEDTPAPLFSNSSDPTRTPTAQSPESAMSPASSREDILETSEVKPEGDSSVNMDQNASVGDSNIETDIDGKPVVGDYLKIMFVEHRVVPTILVCPSSILRICLLTILQSFFFRFPWNNFLHNVVYDVVQQVFNGPMERGYNRSVAINLFESGSITEQIVEGQRRSDEAQQKKNMRLGYMGHLTLVAEEVVKFSERHPAELLSQTVMDKVLEKSWIDYVEQTLSETRERDNAILGGVRPDMSVGPRQAVLNAVNASQGFGNSTALANAGLNGGIGGQQGLDSIDLSNNGSASSAAFGSTSGSLLSGFGSSSDDEDEEMDEADEEDSSRAATALSTADTGISENVGDNAFELEDVVMSDQ
jgi:SIT4-associating protein SAP185/190